MTDHTKITQQLTTLEAELRKINQQLDGAMAKAHFAALVTLQEVEDIYVDPALGKLHRDVTRRTDEFSTA